MIWNTYYLYWWSRKSRKGETRELRVTLLSVYWALLWIRVWFAIPSFFLKSLSSFFTLDSLHRGYSSTLCLTCILLLFCLKNSWKSMGDDRPLDEWKKSLYGVLLRCLRVCQTQDTFFPWVSTKFKKIIKRYQPHCCCWLDGGRYFFSHKTSFFTRHSWKWTDFSTE